MSPPILPPRVDSLSSFAESPDPELLIAESQKDANEVRDLLAANGEPTRAQLQAALSKVSHRVSELVHLLSTTVKNQSDLETQLVLANSNLQLALANTEMLEEALSRSAGPSSGKDIGWRRWSSREALLREEEEESRRQSLEIPYDGHSLRSAPIPSPSTPFSTYLPINKPSTAPKSAPPPTQETSRFFRFRLRGSSPDNSYPTSSGNSSPMPPDSSHLSTAHIASASMPSLALEDSMAAMRESQLQKLLDQERERHQETKKQKAALESEIEQLSQALFEEANKMVADERKRLAEADEELKSVRDQKEALRSALRLVESENDLLRTLATPAVQNFPEGSTSRPQTPVVKVSSVTPLTFPVSMTNGRGSSPSPSEPNSPLVAFKLKASSSSNTSLS